MRFYTKRLRPTLLARVEEIVASTAPIEQLSVVEEIALLRDHCGNAVSLYSEAVESGNAEAVMSAGIVMSSHLQELIKAVDTAARIDEVKTRVSGAFVNAMAAVVTTVCQAASEVWGNDYRVGEFERRLREQLVAKAIPGCEGTDVTPDQDVHGMDDTVPGAVSETAITETEEAPDDEPA